MKHFNYIKVSVFILWIGTFFAPKTSIAQCFEIESILVDACGTPEGENEMVRFSVGNTPLNTNDLTVSWATTANPWLGICQSASTAQTTAQLNATITTCGFLKEPVNGVLPANAKVLLITSTDIDVSFNSFDGLNDTLYIIYQCAGNTAGHFGNYNSSGATRTLTMSFSNPSGCTDAVTYNRGLLLNQNGIPGGNSALKDGGSVSYTPNGTPTYFNNGCQAPIIIDSIAITSPTVAICPLDTVQLTAVSSSSNVFWVGGNGTFSNPTSLNTAYYSSANDNFPLTLYAGFAIPCGDTIYDSIEITQSLSSNLQLSAPDSSICGGETITITASGANSFVWQNGTTASTITVDTAGVYYATTNGCGIDTARFEITWNGYAPTINLTGDSLICQGQSTIITATTTGGTPTWQDGSTATTYTSTTTELIYASVSNVCGTNTAFMQITINGTPPLASINGVFSICDNQPTTLTGTGGDTYLWSNGSTDSTITTGIGNGFLIATNGCGSDTAFYTITDLGNSPSVTLSGDTTICNNTPTLLTATGGDSYLWQDGSTNNTYNALAISGYVIAINGCGSDTAFYTITNLGNSPNATISGNLFICDNQPTTLTVNGGDSYLWDDGTTASNYTTLAGNGFVIAQNDCGIDTAFYTITDLGTSPQATINGNPNICENEISTFTASGGDTYLWSDGNTTNTYLTNQANPIFVIATNQCGSDTAYLALIDQSVYADFDVSDSVGYQPLVIDFINYSQYATQYAWDFGNGTTSTNEHETQTYTNQGIFIVQLVVANDFCLDTAYQNIVIRDNSNVFIPNSFSPNGDNINDTFQPVLTSVLEDDYLFTIFDRNGEVIFTTTTMGEAWNGSYRSTIVPTGVYIWKIQYKVDGDLKLYEKIGHVNVIK